MGALNPVVDHLDGCSTRRRPPLPFDKGIPSAAAYGRDACTSEPRLGHATGKLPTTPQDRVVDGPHHWQPSCPARPDRCQGPGELRDLGMQMDDIRIECGERPPEAQRRLQRGSPNPGRPADVEDGDASGGKPCAQVSGQLRVARPGHRRHPTTFHEAGGQDLRNVFSASERQSADDVEDSQWWCSDRKSRWVDRADGSVRRARVTYARRDPRSDPAIRPGGDRTRGRRPAAEPIESTE